MREAGIYAESHGKRQSAGVPPPPCHSSTAPEEEEGATSRVGFMIIEKTKRKRERERRKACVFPRHTSSCETMIYAFLRTLGSENVTFNQAH